MQNDLGIGESDAVLIEKAIFILAKMKTKVGTSDNLRFYQQRIEHLNRELVKMRKIEKMFKRNRRETESKLKRLERNLYFGSLSESHLIRQFDIEQLFEIQSAFNKT